MVGKYQICCHMSAIKLAAAFDAFMWEPLRCVCVCGDGFGGRCSGRHRMHSCMLRVCKCAVLVWVSQREVRPQCLPSPLFLKKVCICVSGGGRNCPISAALSEPSDSAGWSRQTDRSSQTAPGVVLSEAQCYEPTTPEARTQVETRTLQLYLHTQMCHAHAEN